MILFRVSILRLLVARTSFIFINLCLAISILFLISASHFPYPWSNQYIHEAMNVPWSNQYIFESKSVLKSTYFWVSRKHAVSGTPCRIPIEVRSNESIKRRVSLNKFIYVIKSQTSTYQNHCKKSLQSHTKYSLNMTE